jgi:predicted nucleotide-binding protein (sugar kinase/HSP70/actin superfamily)
LEDTRYLLADLKQQVTAHGAQLTIKGCGVTGYAGDVLQKALNSDVNVVETVAHLRSAQHYCGNDIDVICDIGGQDIKVLFMKHGEIDHFKLSNQCSAGNGMLLQSLAQQFGVPLAQFSDVAFSADSAPEFGYGCAVFLDSDRINFQKEGYRKEEIFAGMCQVLPKNVWQYVVQVPRLEQFGRKFVLQGGTQYNLAAVKAQVDYIKARILNAEVLVHPHTGECGAIGAALESQKVVSQQGHSRFIGINQVAQIQYKSQTGEETRCEFCDNYCPRTFIDIKNLIRPEPVRHITGFACEKGSVESKQQLLTLTKHRRTLKREYPNLVDYESRLLFKHLQQTQTLPVASPHWMDLFKSPQYDRQTSFKRRGKLRIGIPRVLNIYSIAPFMRAYLQALGVKPKNIQFSDQTSERLWDEGSRRGAIDPCFPAKVSQAHLHNLLNKHHKRKSLDLIWFPSITHLSPVSLTSRGNSSCPVVAGTPSVVKAAFTHESDEFSQHGVRYISDLMNLEDKVILSQQLMDSFGELMSLSKRENQWAIQQGFAAMDHIDQELQQRAETILLNAKREHQIVLLLLGRPYHSDPGLNHEILEEFQSLGYPILSVRSLPRRPEFLKPLFEDDIQAGNIADTQDINDIWPENYSTNSSQKVWAAKFAARYPNIAIIDLSSFKCGHDAPTYGLIENIVNSSHTPYFALHDIDANKPSGSINIRVRTFAHNLELFRQTLKQQAQVEHEINKQVFIKRQQMMQSSSETSNDFNDDLEQEQQKIINRIATLASDKNQHDQENYEHTKH